MSPIDFTVQLFEVSIEQIPHLGQGIWNDLQLWPVPFALMMLTASGLVVLLHRGRPMRVLAGLPLMIVLGSIALHVLLVPIPKNSVPLIPILVLLVTPPWLTLYLSTLLMTSAAAQSAALATARTTWGLLPRGISEFPARFLNWRREVRAARDKRREDRIRKGLGLPPSGEVQTGPQIIVVHTGNRGGVVAWFQAMFWMTKIGVVVVGLVWGYFYVNRVVDMTKQWASDTARDVAQEAARSATKELPSWMRDMMK